VLALHSARVVDAELREIASPWPQIGFTRVVPPLGFTGLHLDAPGMATVFRRSLLDLADSSHRPPSRYTAGAMVHDEWVTFLGGVVGPIHLISEPLVLYRQHGANYSGWFERARRVTLEPQVRDYVAVATLTAEYARFLSSIRTDDAAIAARIEAGANHYRRQAERWMTRVNLYESPERRARLRLFRRLLSARAYTARAAGGFGRRALGKDLVAGILLRAGRAS
jgi:hypothetical protein